MNKNHILSSYIICHVRERDVLGIDYQFLVIFFDKDTRNTLCTTSLHQYLVIMLVTVEKPVSHK